jgi:hypothetical protein
MSIELDGIALIRHVRDTSTGATKLISSVHKISVSDKRRISEHKAIRLNGSILQDLGREASRFSFEGILLGNEAKETLEGIWSKFKARKPIPFYSDISILADVTYVLIENLQVVVEGGAKNKYNYWMVLKEYFIPEEEEDVPSQEEEAAEAVEQQTDDELGSINYITGEVVDDDGNLLSGVDVKISFDGGEYVVKTDDKGIFRKDDLDPGRYIVTINAEGFEDVEKEVIIKSGTEETEVIEKQPEKETE